MEEAALLTPAECAEYEDEDDVWDCGIPVIIGNMSDDDDRGGNQ